MDKLREKGETGLFKLQEELISWRGSRKLIILIVAIALLLDNMLLTSVGMSRHSFFFFCYLPLTNWHPRTDSSDSRH